MFGFNVAACCFDVASFALLDFVVGFGVLSRCGALVVFVGVCMLC